MKKAIVFLSAVLALVACSKEIPVTDNYGTPEAPDTKPGTIDPSKLVFDITVNCDSDTKGVKTGWEDGDKIYVTFSYNPRQYVIMTYSEETGWTYTDKDGGTDYTYLELDTTGLYNRATAIHYPSYLHNAPPVITSSAYFVFPDAQKGYFMSCEDVPYTVTSSGPEGLPTLSVTLDMRVPEGLVQFYIDPESTSPSPSGAFVMTVSHVAPVAFHHFYPGGNVYSRVAGEIYGTTDVLYYFDPAAAGHFIPAIETTIGGESGYYFWGILDDECRNKPTDFEFQLVEVDRQYGYAMNSINKTITNKSISTAAIKLDMNNNVRKEQAVSLGFGPRWATGNLNWETGWFGGREFSIADPDKPGKYFCWRRGEDSSSIFADLPEVDAATQYLGSPWRTPTYQEFIDLKSKGKDHWWLTFPDGSRGHMFAGSNGLSVFFLCQGYKENGSLVHFNDVEVSNNWGWYWSSRSCDGEDDKAYFLRLDNTIHTVNGYGLDIYDMKCAMAIRPVHD